MRKRLIAAAMVFALLLTGCTADSDDDGPQPTMPPLPDVAEPLPLAQLAAFSSVATMNAGSNCTGTLIDTGVNDGPAFVLTNGHCVGDVGRSAQTTTLDVEWGGTAEFFRAEGNLDQTHTVEVVGLAYSTMRLTDTAIVRLDAELGELVDLGVRAVPIADSEPAEGSDVVNVGVPVQDLLDTDWVLRRGDCSLKEQHTLIEFAWLWERVWANDCPGIIQGSSGSPLFSLDGAGEPEEIVGLINTTSWGAVAANGGECFLNRPCQVTDDGAVFVEETSYAQSVAGIGRCFDANTGEFATGGECPLPVSDLWAENHGGSFRGGDAPDATGALPSVSLVGAEEGVVRTALVPLGDGKACADSDTYDVGLPVRLPQAGEPWELRGVQVPVDLPETEGRFMLCAVREANFAGAASVLFDVDRTPPLFPASATVEDIGDGAVLVQPHLNPPEISTVRFTWGDPDETDCADTESFRDFFIAPLTLLAEQLPARYCVYGMDAAGNATPVTEIDIPAP